MRILILWVEMDNMYCFLFCTTKDVTHSNIIEKEMNIKQV